MKTIGPWLLMCTATIVIGLLVWRGIIPPATIAALAVALFAWLARSPLAPTIEADLIVLLHKQLDALAGTSKPAEAVITSPETPTAKNLTPGVTPEGKS